MSKISYTAAMHSVFTGKIVSVIGGTSGIGKEIVKQLAQQGAILVIGARNPVPAEDFVAELRSGGTDARFLQLDVQDPKQCEQYYAQLMQELGRIDYAFNCAGTIMAGEIRDHTLKQVDTILKTNVLGTTYCAFYAYRIMAEQGFGHIINLSSGAGIFPLPLMGIYSATKFEVLGLSEVMRMEAKGLGVRVSAVAPGLVDTPLYDKAIYSKADKAKSEKLVKKRLYMIPADKAATKILQGTKRNKAIIFTQSYVHWNWLFYRLTPWLYRPATALAMPLYRKRFRKA